MGDRLRHLVSTVSLRMFVGRCRVRRDPEVAEALANGASLAAVPLVRPTGKPLKANLSLDSGILAAIDEEAARRKLTRSAFVEMIARRMLGEVA
jgi:hypothetical protein